MSDPNQATKNRQYMIVGVALVGIAGLVGAGMFLFEGQAPPPREKPKTVSLTPPGSVDDKDVWRANESARNKSNESTLSELQGKLRSQEETSKKLAKELEDLRTGKQTAAPAAAAASAAASAAKASQGTAIQREAVAQIDAKVLEKPLPQANAQRVLNAPNGRPGLPPPVGGLNTPINGPSVQREAVEMITFGATPAGGAGGAGSTATGGGSSGPEVVGFPTDERAKKYQTPSAAGAGKEDKKGAIEFIPAGSFVRVAMLNGVDAPTGGNAQSNPLPMAFQVLDLANLANKYRLNIKDCRFIAAAWGDVSSERTMGRTESLTCIIDGETVEMPVKGTVIGEDGKTGIRGRLVTKQGQLLANALFAGALSGIGRAFQAAATTTTAGAGGVTQTIEADRVAQAGIGGGVGQAANTLAQYYIKAADKLFPVIETDGGRVVEILITKGATYQGGSAKREQHRGLLRRGGSSIGGASDD